MSSSGQWAKHDQHLVKTKAVGSSVSRTLIIIIIIVVGFVSTYKDDQQTLQC